ncbi:tripartite tricarboxylate transporter substrate binding protein [uncultured Sphaerochaeta sp.]|uniref:tripartite tricarboxylate transporter substrate binding protein n=1 Tax=uncultured Sphaerochaeta sp. TaxID=886478 RepID=UPI002AA75813|nr:tripartite tricarboxylate transporter substrate binding protein [uncultured Sphaerochaeta sp.]
MKNKTLRTSVVVLVLALFSCWSLFAAGQAETTKAEDPSSTYPSSPIQIIVPVGAGGDTDLNARLFSRYLEKELGQSLAVVNVSGGGGTLGMQRVLDSNPDGYTALFFHGEAMIPKIAGLVDFGIEAFEMVGIGVLDDTTVLATHPGMPFQTLPEFISYAKANPGEVEFGMMTGGYPHLVGIVLEEEAGIDLNLVDVGGNAAKTVALMGRKTEVINTQYGLTLDYFKSGDFVVLGLTSKERNPLFPEVPTTAEQGLNLEFNKFFFVGMPKGTPRSIVDKFSAAMKRVVENPEYQAEAEKYFVTPTYMNPEDASAHAQEVYEYFSKYQDLFRGSSK